MAYRTVIHNKPPDEELIQRVLVSLNKAWEEYQNKRGNWDVIMYYQDIKHYQRWLSNNSVKFYQDDNTKEWKEGVKRDNAHQSN